MASSCNKNSVKKASCTARRVVLTAFAATLFLILLLLGERLTLLDALTAGSTHVIEAQRLADQILLYDERLTMAARLAVATGDRAWIRRHETHVPLLVQALTRAGTLAQDVAPQHAGQLNSRSNDKLVDLERQAFARLRAGDTQAATGTLNSVGYTTAKLELVRLANDFMAELQHSVQERLTREGRHAWQNVAGILAGAMLAFAGLWRLLNQRLQQSEHEFVATQATATRLAYYDALTGLANREYLKMQLDRAITRAARHPETVLTVLMIDLDHFKPINDRYGHGMGDRVLVEVSRRLSGGVRKEEIVSRLGADEFIVVLESTDHDMPVSAAQRLIQILAEPMSLAGLSLQISVSVGVATWPADAIDSATLLRRADVALHRAKASGLNQFRFFQQSMDQEVHDRAQLEIDLRHAISNNQIVPFFQPLVDLRTETLTGFEVLARWQHPTRGLVLPKEFIPVAEDTGQIEALTLSVLRTALAAALELDPAISIAINIAPLQLKDDSLVDKLDLLLQELAFPPDRLEVEITENALISDLALAHRVLDKLKERGIRVALDDFGTGYSSLSHLSELPFDKIKIDRSFIQSMHNRPESATIVNAVITLGRSLHLATTAEGIESEHDATLLRQLGCGSGQGYWYARPVPAEEIPDLISRLRPGTVPATRDLTLACV